MALGGAVRAALTPLVGATALPFITFFPAVAATAWYGGAGPGVAAAALSSFVAAAFFLEPAGGAFAGSLYDWTAMVAFVAASSVILVAIAGMHRARGRLEGEVAERQRAEAALAEARDTLATTLASIGDAVIVTDPSGRVTFLNPVAEALTGWLTGQAAGQPLTSVFRIVNEDTRQPIENPVETVLREGIIVGLANHTVLLNRHGKAIPIDDSAAPIRRGEGPLLGVVLIFRDVTAARDAYRTRARLAAIVDHSADAILTKNLDGIIQSWNAAAERLFGYRAEDIVGRSMRTLLPADRVSEEDDILARLREGQNIERFETIRIAKDGRPIHVAVSVSPVCDADGRVIGASTIAHDISDAVAARQALAAERERYRQVADELKQADRRKDEFLAILSHELRNPLAPIRLAVGMLRSAGPGRADLEALQSVIDRQTRQLARLLDDLLDVSRINSGKISLRRDRISMALAIASAIETVRPLIESQGQELSVEYSDPHLDVDGDLGRLSQVFSNLLNNASKYTERGGRIAIRVERVDQEIVVKVSDTGIGIDPSQLPHVFDMFVQVDSSTDRARGGLGVGLSLAKTLVELHGGRIEAESEGLGRGSVFVVRLPAAAHLPRDGQSSSPPAPGSSSTYRILVGDDNVDSAMILAAALNHSGHEVATAHDGHAILAEATRFHPDVALLDIGLPGLDGYEVARRLRQVRGETLTLIAITGWGQEEDKRRAQEAGFDRHLTKPVDLSTLEDLIRTLRRV